MYLDVSPVVPSMCCIALTIAIEQGCRQVITLGAVHILDEY